MRYIPSQVLAATAMIAAALLLAGCEAAAPRGSDGSDEPQAEKHRWTITWEPLPEAVNYNMLLDVWDGRWKPVASITNTDGKTEWTSNTHTGSFDRVRFKVRAVYADGSVGSWSPYSELVR